MAWGFSTEPEFEERLAWTRRGAARGVVALVLGQIAA